MGIFIAGFWVLGLNFTFFQRILRRILPYRYARYMTSEGFSNASILVGVFGAILFLLVWFFMNDSERDICIEKCYIGNWMFTLNMCFFGLNLAIEAGARMAALFGPYLICLIPQMIDEIKDSERRRWLITIIVMLSFMQFVARLLINNIGGTMPYQFFWT